MSGSSEKGTAASIRMTGYRHRMRAAGLRPVQIWVPDTRAPAFAAKCRRQARAIAADDADELELMRFVEQVHDGSDPE